MRNAILGNDHKFIQFNGGMDLLEMSLFLTNVQALKFQTFWVGQEGVWLNSLRDI